MPNKLPPAPKWWPERAYGFASHHLYKNAHGARKKEIFRLLTDKRMKAVVEKLTPSPRKKEQRGTMSTKQEITRTMSNERDMDAVGHLDWFTACLDATKDPLSLFIFHASNIRGFWRDSHDQPLDYEDAYLRRLKSACDTLLDYLEHKKDKMSRVVKSARLGDGPIEAEKAKHQSLVQMLHRISDFAAKGSSGLYRELFNRISEAGIVGVYEEEFDRLSKLSKLEPHHPIQYVTKLRSKTAEEVYVTRYLSENANFLLQKTTPRGSGNYGDRSHELSGRN